MEGGGGCERFPNLKLSVLGQFNFKVTYIIFLGRAEMYNFVTMVY
jgi:hypothetical protein